jgi:hypothetical protein
VERIVPPRGSSNGSRVLLPLKSPLEVRMQARRSPTDDSQQYLAFRPLILPHLAFQAKLTPLWLAIDTPHNPNLMALLGIIILINAQRINPKHFPTLTTIADPQTL